MKPGCVGWISAGLCGVAAGGMVPLPGHWDVTPTYSVASSAWSWAITDGPVSQQPEGSFFPGFDGDYFAGEGERLERPPGAAWDFLGVDEGEPVWIFPETVTYGEQAEPGFGATQSGVFSGNLRVMLAGVDGPPGGNFSLFDNGGTYMATADGIDGNDVLVKPSFHSHQNWAFTRQGLWRVRLQVMGYLGPGETNPTPLSAEVPLHFAIGGLARWRAENFAGEVVMDDAVAGSEADPDGDGLANLVEYALGGDPENALASEHGGPTRPQAGIEAGRLTLSFHRRSDPAPDAGISIGLEWADAPGGPWQTGGVETSVVPVGADWEQVTVRDEAGAGAGRRFVRLRVTETP